MQHFFVGRIERFFRIEEIMLAENDDKDHAQKQALQNNPMLDLFAMCGRCDLISEACVMVTVRTMHKGHDKVELCQKCLDELAAILRVFVDDRHRKIEG